MYVQRVRGSNDITFVFTEKSEQSKAKALLNYKGSTFRYLFYKFKNALGFTIPPYEVLIVIEHGYKPNTIKKSDKPYMYNEATTADFYVESNNKFPTPMRVLRYGANIIKDLKKHLEEKNETSDKFNYEILSAYKVNSITFVPYYPKERYTAYQYKKLRNAR